MDKPSAHIIAMLIALIAVSSAPSWSFEQLTFKHQNTERQYLLHNEKAAANAPKPLIVVLHGWRKQGQTVHGEDKLDNQLYAELDELALTEDFLTLYPMALRGQWNLFDRKRDKFTLDSGQIVDDVAYIRALITDVISRQLADPRRIYLTGFSDGAILSYRLLCEKGQIFAAAVPMMGTMHQSQYDNCTPDTLPAILALAGTHDKTLPYFGWIYEHTGREVSIPETMEVWRKLHHCTGQKDEQLENTNNDDHSQIVQMTWTNCDVDQAVQLYRIEGGGHQIPSLQASKPSWVEKFGNRNQDIEAAHAAWAFLKGFSRAE